MKVQMLADSTVTVKAGTIVDIDEKQYNILKGLKRCIPYEKKTKKEKQVESKRETRKEKK